MNRDRSEAREHHDAAVDPGRPYEVLGVSPDASQEAIVHAYRRLARASHPDARPGDPQATAQFRVLTSAYEVLSDAARRADYDRARRASRAAPYLHPEGGPSPYGVRLDRSSKRAVEVPLRAGPVRVEEPRGRITERTGPLRAHDRHEPDGPFLLLRYLIDGWWSE